MVADPVNLVQGKAQADEAKQVFFDRIAGNPGAGADGFFTAALRMEAKQ